MKNEMTGYASIDEPQNNGYSFFKKNPIIPNVSIYNLINMFSFFYKTKFSIDCLDLNVSYDQLFKDSVTLSRALKELGVKKGQIISIAMPNYYQAIASFLACNRIGAVTTFLNSSAEKEEIYDYLNLFESPIFINYDKNLEENIDCKKNTNVKYIITLDKQNVCDLDIFHNYHITTNKDVINFNSLGSISKFQKKGMPTNNANDDSLILFTSGSTGKPKSVVLTNKNIVSAGIYLKNSSKVSSLNGEKTLVCVPFSYPYGFVTSTLMTLMSGKTAVLAPNMSKETIVYYLKKNPNIIFGSPALLDLIMNNTPENINLSSITSFISGGDFLTPSHSNRGKEFFKKHGASNIEMGNGSGNAETVSCGTNSTGIKIRPETAGKILVGTKAIIIDENTNKEKKYNEEGLLCVSGNHVFKGYFNEPELTKKSMIEINGIKYFKTGTMGFIDKDGYFTLTGRQSRFYIISTLNKVYCDHVQSIISNIDLVQECSIVKVPDEKMLYVNKAYIVLNESNIPKNISEDKLKELLFEKFKNIVIDFKGNHEQLKWYEIPTYLEFVNELPRRTGTDKINYDLLEKDALKEISNDNIKILKKI